MIKNELEKRRPGFFFLGLIVASSLTLTAFSWRYEKEHHSYYMPLDDESLLVEIDIGNIQIEREELAVKELANTKIKKKASIIPSDRPRKVLMKISNKSSKLSALKNLDKRNSIEPSLRTNSNSSVTSFRDLQIHEMPYLRICGHIKDDIERFQCTQSAMRQHIAEEFKIPPIHAVKSIPERIYVTFVIDEYGNINEIVSSNNIDPLLLDEVTKVFTSMPEMVPAISLGRRMAVRFEVPVAIKRL